MSNSQGLLEDPFPAVQKEVSASFRELQSIRSRLSEAELNERLKVIEDDVSDLRRALDIAKQDPRRYNLSEEEIQRRSDFLNDISRHVQSFSSPSTNTVKDEYIDGHLQQQQLQLQTQDEHLDDLANAVQRIGVLGRDMHNELEQQGEMLDDLGGRFDTTMHRLKAIRQRVEVVMEQTGRRQFCTIVWLCITFLILTILIVIL